MKFIAVILSIYVMVLTAIPCNDVHAANTNSVSLELLEQSPNQSNDVDLCSPFCFCNCCQTLPWPNIFDNSQYTFIGSEFSFIVVEQIYPNPTISFWRPPKI